MAVSRLALAQRGIALADAVPGPAKMRRGREAERLRRIDGIIPTALTETLNAMSIDAPGGPFGYRIYGFESCVT